MARINSIAMGKAHGKIGNVVFQSYKGGTYARQRNETITVPPTDAQVAQQNKIYNSSRACSFVLPFFANYNKKTLKGLSFTSWFVKQSSQLFTNFRALRGFQSIRQLAGQSIGSPHILQLTASYPYLNQGEKAGVTIEFTKQFEQYEDNMRMHVMCTNIVLSGGTNPISSVVIRDVEITLVDWERGYCDIEIENFDTQFIIAYSDQYYSGSDNILFSNIIE